MVPLVRPPNRDMLSCDAKRPHCPLRRRNVPGVFFRQVLRDRLLFGYLFPDRSRKKFLSPVHRLGSRPGRQIAGLVRRFERAHLS